MILSQLDMIIHHKESLEVEGHIFYMILYFKFSGDILTQNNELRTEVLKWI